MKKVFITLVLLTLAYNMCQAQEIQSHKPVKFNFEEEHLKTLQITELAYYLKRARFTKTAGILMIIVLPPPAFIVGLAAGWSGMSGLAAIASIGGISAIVGGVSFTIIGSKRTRAVKSEYSHRNVPVKAKISPTLIQLPQSNQLTTGISFTLSF